MRWRGDAGLDVEQRVGQIRQRFIPEGTFAHIVEINVEAGRHRRTIDGACIDSRIQVLPLEQIL